MSPAQRAILTSLDFKVQTRLALLLFVGILIGSYALGQDLSIGLVAGANLTNGIAPNPEINLVPGARSVIARAMLERSFGPRFSLEVDGLYRGLRGRFAGPVSPSNFTDVTWEFPVLAKFRFTRGSLLTPFVEAGPSFRLAQIVRSHAGIAAGAGVDLRINGLRVSPQIRYTYWDAPTVGSSTTPANQVELLVGLSTVAKTVAHPLGPGISFGLLAGASVTGDFHSRSSPGVFCTVTGMNTTACVNGTVYDTSGSRYPMIGATIQYELTRPLSVELDAVQRYLTSAATYVVPVGTAPQGFGGSNSVSTWQFPVLTRYNFFQERQFSPFAAAGPSFRLPQEVNGGYLSNYGGTIGAGVETHLRRMGIAPTARFTHWGSGSPSGQSRAIDNQVEILVAFGFYQSRP